MTPKRRYDTTRRRAAAEERRTRVAAVAADMFSRRGWSATTIAAVAAEAAVSAELVSSAFGGKPGLFMAAFRHASFGGVSLPDAFAALHLEEEPDVEVRLDRFVEFACVTLERMAPLVSVLALGADQDEELRDLVAAAHERHAATARAAISVLAPGPVGDDALDEVYLLTRAETYLTFVDQRGWSRERYAAWLRRSIRAAVAPSEDDGS